MNGKPPVCQSASKIDPQWAWNCAPPLGGPDSLGRGRDLPPAGAGVIQLRRPLAQLRPRLDLSIVRAPRPPRAHHLAHRVARDVQFAGDLADRPAVQDVLASNPSDRLHNKHPLATPVASAPPSRLNQDDSSSSNGAWDNGGWW